MGIGQFQLNLNFGSIPVLLHDHTPSHSTGHEKIHCIWYPECQNWTIFSDFRSENPPCPLELIAFVTFFDFEHNYETFRVLLHDQTPSRSIRHEKIHGIRYPERQNRTIFRDSRISYLIEVKSDNRDKL